MFITVEGIEASGKTTLLDALAARFVERDGVAAVRTREPGGTPLGDRLRAVFLDATVGIEPLAETLLLCASRAQLVRNVIRPALAAGCTVLCDRFFDATVAYQGYGRGVDVETVTHLSLIATGGLEPDLTFLVDVPVEVSAARVGDRARRTGTAIDRVEREGSTFHRRVREGYLALAARQPARIRVLDGCATPETLVEAAWREILAARRRAAGAGASR